MPAMINAARIRFATLSSACLLLAACGDNTAAPEAPDGELDARGEVLGGTISDAMLPLDGLTSQSPPLRAADGNEEDEGPEEVAPGDEAEPQPSEEPAPEPQADEGTEEDPAG